MPWRRGHDSSSVLAADFHALSAIPLGNKAQTPPPDSSQPFRLGSGRHIVSGSSGSTGERGNSASSANGNRAQQQQQGMPSDRAISAGRSQPSSPSRGRRVTSDRAQQYAISGPGSTSAKGTSFGFWGRSYGRSGGVPGVTAPSPAPSGPSRPASTGRAGTPSRANSMHSGQQQQQQQQPQQQQGALDRPFTAHAYKTPTRSAASPYAAPSVSESPYHSPKTPPSASRYGSGHSFSFHRSGPNAPKPLSPSGLETRTKAPGALQTLNPGPPTTPSQLRSSFRTQRYSPTNSANGGSSASSSPTKPGSSSASARRESHHATAGAGSVAGSASSSRPLTAKTTSSRVDLSQTFGANLDHNSWSTFLQVSAQPSATPSNLSGTNLSGIGSPSGCSSANRLLQDLGMHQPAVASSAALSPTRALKDSHAHQQGQQQQGQQMQQGQQQLHQQQQNSWGDVAGAASTTATATTASPQRQPSGGQLPQRQPSGSSPSASSASPLHRTLTPPGGTGALNPGSPQRQPSGGSAAMQGSAQHRLSVPGGSGGASILATAAQAGAGGVMSPGLLRTRTADAASAAAAAAASAADYASGGMHMQQQAAQSHQQQQQQQPALHSGALRPSSTAHQQQQQQQQHCAVPSTSQQSPGASYDAEEPGSPMYHRRLSNSMARSSDSGQGNAAGSPVQGSPTRYAPSDLPGAANLRRWSNPDAYATPAPPDSPSTSSPTTHNTNSPYPSNNSTNIINSGSGGAALAQRAVSAAVHRRVAASEGGSPTRLQAPLGGSGADSWAGASLSGIKGSGGNYAIESSMELSSLGGITGSGDYGRDGSSGGSYSGGGGRDATATATASIGPSPLGQQRAASTAAAGGGGSSVVAGAGAAQAVSSVSAHVASAMAGSNGTAAVSSTAAQRPGQQPSWAAPGSPSSAAAVAAAAGYAASGAAAGSPAARPPSSLRPSVPGAAPSSAQQAAAGPAAVAQPQALAASAIPATPVVARTSSTATATPDSASAAAASSAAAAPSAAAGTATAAAAKDAAAKDANAADDADAFSAQLPGYSVGRVVGEGGFCQVRLGIHHLSRRKVAIKIIDKAKLSDPNEQKRIQREIRVLRRLNHESVIKIFEVVDTPGKMYLVMEYAPSGSLLDYVRGRKRLGEPEAAYFLQQIVAGLQYCHANEVVHRDVKLENILLDSTNAMKVIDFGLSAFYAPGKKLRVHCGSPSYAAPEIVARKTYEGPPVDVWSLGVVLFAMVAGFLPFHSSSGNKQELCQKIIAGVYNAPEYLSPHCKDLLSRMLTVDPDARITFDEVLQHPWVRSSPKWDRPSGSVYIVRVDSVSGAVHADESVVSELEVQGYPRAVTLRALGHGEANYITASYYLLAEAKAEAARKLLPAKPWPFAPSIPTKASSGSSGSSSSSAARQPQQAQQQVTNAVPAVAVGAAVAVAERPRMMSAPGGPRSNAADEGAAAYLRTGQPAVAVS